MYYQLILPGHGNSEGPCLHTIEEIADWLEKVFIKLKLEKLFWLVTPKDVWRCLNTLINIKVD